MKQIQLDELENLDMKLLDCLACLDFVDYHNLPSAIRKKYDTLVNRIQNFSAEVNSMYESEDDYLTEDNDYGMDGKPITITVSR